jgi:hypothetical protein
LTNDVVKLRDFLVDLNELNVYGNIFWLKNFGWIWWVYSAMKLMMLRLALNCLMICKDMHLVILFCFVVIGCLETFVYVLDV